MKRLEPPTFGHVCKIAREELEADPTIDDSEWKARIKHRLLHLGFAYPQPLDMLGRAMSAVERAMERHRGRRPAPSIPQLATPGRTEAPNLDPPWRRPRRESRQSLRELVEMLRQSGSD